MKRGKKLLALLLVLAAVLAAAWAATLLNPEYRSSEEEEAETVFTLDPDTVTALSWDYSEPLEFEKEDGAWIYAPDPVFPLDSSYLDTILDTLSQIVSYKTIEDVEDWDQYTLEVPICQIDLTAGGVDYTLMIGEETAVGGQRYFSIGDGCVYLVDSTILSPFSYALYDLLSYEQIPDMDEVQSLNLVSDAQSYEIVYQENSGLAYSDSYVWFLSGQALDTQLTKALLSSVINLSWIECVNYNAEDPGDYGLDQPVVTATVCYTVTEQVLTEETDEDGEPVYESRSSEESFTLEIGGMTGTYRYARIAGSSMVYTIAGGIADTLMYTTYYELLPDEVLLMDWEEVNAVDILLDGQTYTVTRGTQTVTDDEGNETEETVWTLDGETVDLEDLLDSLDDLDSSGYATGLTAADTAQIAFVIYRDRDTFPEVELAFYTYDSSSCMTTLNDSATVFTSREDVADLVSLAQSLVD